MAASSTSRKSRSTASPEDQEASILDAAAAEFVSVGVRRANMDEVAVNAGVSRSTLYRRFPNKDNLLVAVANLAYERGMRRLEAAVTGLPPREAVVEAFATGAQMVTEDPLLNRMVLEDYEIRGITASMSGMFINIVTERVVQTLRRAGAEMPDADLHRAVEVHVRLVTSYLEVPSDDESLRTPEGARELASKFLAPMIW
ncbi:helix-turn-helix transcriptional regulator [Gordonia sp. TBRC 11910]|uniref:Helix-turn-helix transcriptional regulator n=1 Tax=Gordonia asplenii TaxID=2725283 RepID=A0A848KU11_9ACTN|nr:TetR/AcrR family transcriptional regulator [Gordonia asplenii]NMO02186.1 helix-turn-helix transcriptional regulator [Gordonia asplenii]